MPKLHPHQWRLPLLLLIGLIVFASGITWGLPSRATDVWLFGNRTPWTGRQIVELAGGWEERPDLGADVALRPMARRDRVVNVNASDVQRARIVRRYRLASYQPDEISTLRALAGMNPRQGRLDPRLYQYGGLWIYPVGAMLQAASKLGIVQVRADVAWYMDHPAAFGRFYVVARSYCVLWALAGVIAVYLLVRQIVGGWAFPSAAALAFILMPVVVNMAHEAKPHLPGAVLMLWAVWAGARYIEKGSMRAALAAGALCGAALGMVLSCLPVFCVPPLMVLLRKNGGARRRAVVCFASLSIGAIAYLMTNPYIPINLLHNRAVLASSFGNNRAMYHPQLTANGIATTGRLVAAGTSPLLALAGIAGTIALGWRALRVRRNHEPAEIRRRAVGLLVAAPALGVVAQCVIVATGKPGEFGRFLLMPDIVLMFEAIVALATFLPRQGCQFAATITLLFTTAGSGLLYVRGFVRDSRPLTRRLEFARQLKQLNDCGNKTLALYAEPAPYCMPPADLFRWRLELLPSDSAPQEGVKIAGVSIQATDLPAPRLRESAPAALWRFLTATPISWADKPFDLRVVHVRNALGQRPEVHAKVQ